MRLPGYGGLYLAENLDATGAFRVILIDRYGLLLDLACWFGLAPLVTWSGLELRGVSGPPSCDSKSVKDARRWAFLCSPKHSSDLSLRVCPGRKRFFFHSVGAARAAVDGQFAEKLMFPYQVRPV